MGAMCDGIGHVRPAIAEGTGKIWKDFLISKPASQSSKNAQDERVQTILLELAMTSVAAETGCRMSLQTPIRRQVDANDSLTTLFLGCLRVERGPQEDSRSATKAGLRRAKI